MIDIDREHPEYTALKHVWRRYRDLYSGGERLKRIAWCLVGVMLVQFLASLVINWIAPDNNIAGHIEAGEGPSRPGCLAVLLVFVLARTLRHGTERRDGMGDQGDRWD